MELTVDKCYHHQILTEKDNIYETDLKQVNELLNRCMMHSKTLNSARKA